MFHVKQLHVPQCKTFPKCSNCSPRFSCFKKETKLLPHFPCRMFPRKTAIPAPLPKWDKIPQKGDTSTPNKPRKALQNAKNTLKTPVLGQKKAHGLRIRGLFFVISYLLGNFQRLF